VISASIGMRSTCAALAQGGVVCFGYNLYGQLGVGSTSSVGGNPRAPGTVLAVAKLGKGDSCSFCYVS
jgi:alpha-tubulin suppressor-like RCC1 family protein